MLICKPHRLTEAARRAFDADSFVNLGQIFTPHEVADVRAGFERVLQVAPPGVEIIRESGSGEVRSVMGWENADPVLDQFTRDVRVLEAVQSVIGDEVVFQQTKYNPKAPGGKGEKWDPHRGITYWHYRDGVPDPNKMISVFVALTEQTKENGATYTWKGAHYVTLADLKEETDFSLCKEGETSDDTAASLSIQIKPQKIAEYDQKFEKIYLEGPEGTVWLLDSRNLHASQPNRSHRVRILVANVYRSITNYPKHPRDKEFLCGTSKIPLKPFVRTESEQDLISDR